MQLFYSSKNSQPYKPNIPLCLEKQFFAKLAALAAGHILRSPGSLARLIGWASAHAGQLLCLVSYGYKCYIWLMKFI